jgi:GNAT superfamily N-acetyltransferase
MNREEDLIILMCWSSESLVSEYPDPHDFVYETSGDLFKINEFESREFIGKFRVYYVDVERAMNQREPIYDVFDSHSAEVEEYYEPIFDSEGYGFNENLLEIVSHEVSGYNLLILDRLEILPQYRRKKLGLTLLHHMIERFSAGASIVAMKPFPLQFEPGRDEDKKKWRDKMRLDQFPKDENIAREKLSTYYRKLGFIHLSGTPMMVISTDWALPTNW